MNPANDDKPRQTNRWSRTIKRVAQQSGVQPDPEMVLVGDDMLCKPGIVSQRVTQRFGVHPDGGDDMLHLL